MDIKRDFMKEDVKKKDQNTIIVVVEIKLYDQFRRKIVWDIEKPATVFYSHYWWKKIITNHILYNSLEEEALRVQEKMGRENKKKIIAECKEKGWKIPNFRREGIGKN